MAMATALLLSKATATKHPATVESRILHQIHRLSPSCNLGFTANVDFSCSSIKINFTHAAMKLKPPKSSSASLDGIQFHLPMLDHEADRLTPTCLKNQADAILNLKKPAIPQVTGTVIIIGAVLLMSCPPSGWARVPVSAYLHCRCRAPVAIGPWTWVDTVIFGSIVSICIFERSLFSLIQAVRNWGITTVLNLQLGLSGSRWGPLERELELIAEIPSTSSHTVQSRVLTETARALLCYPEACISAYSNVHVERNIKGCKKMFDQLCTNEHASFNGKTLLNEDDIQRYHLTNLRDGVHNNDYKVVTILVLARGDHKTPSIKGITDLKNALLKLESIPPTDIMDLKVVWTPQAEKTLSEKEVSPLMSLAGSQDFV